MTMQVDYTCLRPRVGNLICEALRFPISPTAALQSDLFAFRLINRSSTGALVAVNIFFPGRGAFFTPPLESYALDQTQRSGLICELPIPLGLLDMHASQILPHLQT